MKKQVLLFSFGIGMLFIAACDGKDDMSTNPNCPDCPVITDISPASGLPGTEITITGKNFSSLETVLFDGANAVAITPSKTTATQTMVITPDIPNKNGPVKVTVTRKFTNGAGNSSTTTSTENITFTYTKAPEIANIAPLSAKKGETLTITGKYLGASPMVRFPNGTTIAATVINDSEIHVAVPSKSGNGKIQVTTGGQTATSAQDFTYVFSYTVSTPFALDGYPSDLNFSNGTFITEFYGNNSWFGLQFIPTSGSIYQKYLANWDPNGWGGPLAGGGIRPDGKYVYIDPNSSTLIASATDANSNDLGLGSPGISGSSVDIACITNEQFAVISYEGFVNNLNIIKINGFPAPPSVTPVTNISQPGGVCVLNGKIYATGRYSISEIISGTAEPIVGSGLPGFADGTFSEARFSDLYGIAMAESTKIYVADGGNRCIRLIDLTTGKVSTIAGNGSNGFIDGSGTTAQFGFPHSICFDQEGNLFVSDYSNKAIRKITIE